MRRTAAALALGLTLTGAARARADDGPGARGGEAAGDGPRGHHQGQVGVALSFATGYRFIKTWEAERYCGTRASAGDGGGNAAYCFARTPAVLDLSLSYGVTRAIEVMLDVRLGLERDFGSGPGADGPRLRHYAPGVKFWLSTGTVAYFTTAQLAIDATGYTAAGGGDLGLDLRLRNTNGLQVDFHDSFGAYVYFGEQVAFRRWLEVGLEAGIGVQGRYP